VGGSSNIPQVVEAVDNYFSKASMLEFSNREMIHTSIALGAAYHALSLALYNKGIVRTVSHDDISIRSKTGLVKLIEKGTVLPYPANGGFAENRSLAVPSTVLKKPLSLKIELNAGDAIDKRLLFKENWLINVPANQGDSLLLKFRYDENQVLDFEMCIDNKPDMKPFSGKIENPITNVVNPNNKRVEIDEMEEDLRTGNYAKDKQLEIMTDLAGKYAELGQNEKAVAYYKKVLIASGRGNPYILNAMGTCYGKIGDFTKEEKVYREAANLTNWNGPLFNLALSQHGRGLDGEALKTINLALKKEQSAPDIVLKAKIESKLGSVDASRENVKKALSEFKPIENQSKWELGWYQSALGMNGDTEKLAEVKAFIKKGSIGGEETQEELFPIEKSAITRVIV
jgi:tetratricopeptide (TPR) repeat protein